ncbi:MAG: TetR/AcrR family transcriptional regulator [Deltaproteobacteria bacterium]|jgi:AcrR family transcriptional regulator|nr:TetR/AcrR family transcriptional regulator [Deltaproteobacteria bacterium]
MKTRDKIIKGARDYLLREGQAGFTVRAIAAEAGVNQGLVHHYFGSKENLITELIDIEAERPFAKLKGDIAGKQPQEIISLVLKTFFLNQEFVNLLLEFINLAQHSDVVKIKVKSIMKSRKAFISSVLGIEDPVDKTVLVGGIFGIVLQSKVLDAIDIEISVQRLLSKLGLDG